MKLRAAHERQAGFYGEAMVGGEPIYVIFESGAFPVALLVIVQDANTARRFADIDADCVLHRGLSDFGGLTRLGKRSASRRSP